MSSFWWVCFVFHSKQIENIFFEDLSQSYQGVRQQNPQMDQLTSEILSDQILNSFLTSSKFLF